MPTSTTTVYIDDRAWTCDRCGQRIPAGTYHTCATEQQPHDWHEDWYREIAASLDRIANTLDRIAARL